MTNNTRRIGTAVSPGGQRRAINRVQLGRNFAAVAEAKGYWFADCRPWDASDTQLLEDFKATNPTVEVLDS